MAGRLWTPEAEDLTPAGASGAMEGGQPKVTLHVTVSPSGKSPAGTSYFDAMHRVLRSAQAEPHYLYDPLTDRLGQYFPLNRSARALRNDGTKRTNGSGICNIQIEVVAMPDGFTRYWKPGPNYRAMLRDIRSWGVPDVWPAGRLSKTGSDAVSRSWTNYVKAGWFGHCNVPGNDHWDPGPIDQKAVFLTSEEEFMDVKNPISGEQWPAEKALWSIWTYAIKAAQDAAVARKLAEAQAKVNRPLTADETAAAAKAGLDEIIANATVNLDVAPTQGA
jgi:hypothetical protein